MQFIQVFAGNGGNSRTAFHRGNSSSRKGCSEVSRCYSQRSSQLNNGPRFIMSNEAVKQLCIFDRLQGMPCQFTYFPLMIVPFPRPGSQVLYLHYPFID